MDAVEGFSLNLPWPSSSVSSLLNTVSGLYCIFSITVYLVITINKFVRKSLQNYAEIEVG